MKTIKLLNELKEIQKSATEVTDMVAELGRKTCEVAVRLHNIIEEIEDGK